MFLSGLINLEAADFELVYAVYQDKVSYSLNLQYEYPLILLLYFENMWEIYSQHLLSDSH